MLPVYIEGKQLLMVPDFHNQASLLTQLSLLIRLQ